MALRRSNSVLAAVLSACLLMMSLSCAGAPSPQSSTNTSADPSPRPSPSFGGARFEVRAPFSTAALEIEPDGTVRYEASSPRTGIDRQTASKRVGSDAIASLMETTQDARFFSLEASYPYREGISCEDGSTYLIQVTIGGETKQVTCYEPECPEGFNRVINAIRNIWAGEILEVGV